MPGLTPRSRSRRYNLAECRLKCKLCRFGPQMGHFGSQGMVPKSYECCTLVPGSGRLRALKQGGSKVDATRSQVCNTLQRVQVLLDKLHLIPDSIGLVLTLGLMQSQCFLQLWQLVLESGNS